MIRTIRLLYILILLAAVVFSDICAFAEPQKVTMTLHWYPQTQFAGYYIAKEKGFYLKRGVDLEIRRGGADVDALKELAEGKTTFITMFLTGAIRFRSKELPLINVGQIVNRSNLFIVAKKKSKILQVTDLNGRRMSLWGDHFSAAYKKLFSDRKIWPVVMPQFFSVELFLRGAVDACNAMSYNEYQRILLSGYRPEDLTVISLRDEGYDFPEDGIYCLEETWKKDPELCRNVLEASLEGWRYSASHPKEAIDLVTKLADDAKYIVNRLLLQRMLDTILPSIFPEDPSEWTPGVLSRADYDTTATMIHQMMLVPGGITPYEIFAPYAVSSDVH